MAETRKYSLLIRVAERPNNNSAYVFYKTHSADGKSVVYETTDGDELDEVVEELINDGLNIGGRIFMPKKKDLVIVSIVDWFADAVSDIMGNNLHLATETDINETVEEIFDQVINNGEDGEDGENGENGSESENESGNENENNG